MAKYIDYQGNTHSMSMDSEDEEEEPGPIAKYDKRKDRSTHIILVSFLAFVAICMFSLTIALLISPETTIARAFCSAIFIGLGLLALWVLPFGLEGLRPDEVLIYRDSVRLYRKSRLVQSMALDGTVKIHLDLESEKVLRPTGYIFISPTGKLEFSTSRGYNKDDMYQAWAPIRMVVLANGLQTTEDFEKYSQYRERAAPPVPKDPLGDRPPLTAHQLMRESKRIIEAEEHETGRAKELVRRMNEERTAPENTIWSTEWKHRWSLTFAKAQILAVFILGAALGGVWDDGKGLNEAIVIIAIALVLEILFAWSLKRWNRRQMDFYEARTDMEWDDTFRSMIGVFKALGIAYTLSTDVDTMPSKRQWYDGQIVAIAFELEGQPFILEVLGYTGGRKTLLLLSNVPKVENPALENLMGFLSVALTEEIAIRRAGGVSPD